MRAHAIGSLNAPRPATGDRDRGQDDGPDTHSDGQLDFVVAEYETRPAKGNSESPER
jgi:hypothetical protein